MGSDWSQAREQIEVAEASRANAQRHLIWWRNLAVVVFPLHLIIAAMTVGLRAEHIGIDAALLTMALSGPRWRRVSLHAMAFYGVGLMWDFLGYITPFRGEIQVGTLHEAELQFIPSPTNAQGSRATWATWFQSHTHPVLDLFAGFAYMAYLFQIIVLGLIFLWKEPITGKVLAYGFLFVNIAGIATHMVYPTAPPWYVEMFGVNAEALDIGNYAAGALRFDLLVGVDYFENFYARGTNTFGALPSLHAAYPILAALTLWRRGAVWATSTISFALLVSFAAVYLHHHYILDILAGGIYAAFAYFLAAWVVHRFDKSLQG